jgi:hypothetical protein
MRFVRFPFVALAGLFVFGSGRSLTADEPALNAAHPLLGTLECDPKRSAAMSDAGAQAVVVGLSWDQSETADGQFNEKYLDHIGELVAEFRAAKKAIVLDCGVQYPPAWIFRDPASHFVNQYGEAYTPAAGAGDCGVNLVFSQAMRDKYQLYVSTVFQKLGTDFAAVRLGGGRYGEQGYPINVSGGHANCYWAFDDLAQAKGSGLPLGVAPCPVAGWRPGQASPGHDSARQFLNWYMESMRNYHDWQIAMTRHYFSGPLFMLYPSIGGLRPGQLDAAIADDADGSTGAEKTGEVGRGFDTARFVAGITDPKVVVYSTWIDGFFGSDDASPDPARWSPGHFVASLAAAHQPPLLAGGENTGEPDDLANMQLTFQRMRENHLCVMFWAFEHTLFDGKRSHATISDFKKLAGGMPTP